MYKFRNVFFLSGLVIASASTAFAGSAAKLADLQSEKVIVEAETGVARAKKQLKEVLPPEIKMKEALADFDLSNFFVNEVYGMDEDLVAVVFTPNGGSVRVRKGDKFNSFISIQSISEDKVTVYNSRSKTTDTLQFYADAPKKQSMTPTMLGPMAQQIPTPSNRVSISNSSQDDIKLLPPPIR